jgi:hypothetical protein
MSKAHPGFKNVAAAAARRQGVSVKEASAEIAASSRNASKAAKRNNPRLAKVSGGHSKQHQADMHRRYGG